jgi:hypothetical protein
VGTNADFVPKKEASLCEYPYTRRPSEPATSINAFARWASATDFALKHCSAAQLFQQQLLRNPLCMHAQPERVYASLTGPVQMDGRFFIGHTNMFVGAYEQPVREQPHAPKITQLRAAVSLQAIAVVTNAVVDSRFNKYKAELCAQMDEHTRQGLAADMWVKFERMLVEPLEAFVQALERTSPSQELMQRLTDEFLGKFGKQDVTQFSAA